jgi:hypothetical protein
MLLTLYDLTQGITDILVILFKLAQQRAMSDGSEAVTVDCIRVTYDEQLVLLHPAINALRKNTSESLTKFEDLLPPSLSLIDQATPASLAEDIDSRLDELLEGQNVQAAPRPLVKGGRARKGAHQREELPADDIRSVAQSEDVYNALQQLGAIGDPTLFGKPNTQADRQ